MKDHKRVEVYIGSLYGPMEEEIIRIRTAAEGIINPELVTEGWDDSYYIIKGWMPMTDREKAAAERRQVASRKANEAKKEKAEAAERAEYERLVKKYAET